MECTISGQDDPCMRRDCSGVKFTEDEVVKEDVAKVTVLPIILRL